MATRRTRRKTPALAKRVPTSPIVASLRGILKNADPEAYRKHLIQKYL